MSQLKVAVSGLVGWAFAGCVASAASNYAVQYRMVGSATETAAHNGAAEASFRAELTDVEKQQLSGIRVYFDSVPAELTMSGTTVGVAPGAAAALLGTVELTAVSRVPDEVEVLLPIQRATRAAGGTLAFCPRSEHRQVHVWRCYLVRTGAGVPSGAAGQPESTP